MELRPYELDYGIIKYESTVKAESHNSHLFLLIGASGSGKSTTANKLSDEFGIPVICMDNVYMKYFLCTQNPDKAIELASEAIDELMGKALQENNVVIFDVMLLDLLSRLIAIRAFRPLFSRITALFFDLDDNELLMRNLDRDTPVNKDFFLELALLNSLKNNHDLLSLGIDEVYIGKSFDSFQQI